MVKQIFFEEEEDKCGLKGCKEDVSKKNRHVQGQCLLNFGSTPEFCTNVKYMHRKKIIFKKVFFFAVQRTKKFAYGKKNQYCSLWSKKYKIFTAGMDIHNGL